MRKYLQFFKMGLYDLLEYRANFFWSVGGITISALVVYLFWMAILRSGAPQSDYTPQSLSLYFLVIALVSQMTHTSFWDISHAIRDGNIATELCKPYSYSSKTLITSLADRLLKTMVFLTLVVFMTWHFDLPARLNQLGLFLISVSLAAACKFLISLTIGYLSFWFSRVHGFGALFWNIGGLFSGELIPPEFLPPLLLKISGYLPFSLFAYFPASTLIHPSQFPQDVTKVFLQLCWLFVFYLVFRITWRAGIRQIESIGG